MSEKNTKETCILVTDFKDAHNPKRLLADIIANGNIISEFSSRFKKIEVRTRPTGVTNKKWIFWGAVEHEHKYEYWLIIDTTGLNEHQLDLLNAHMVGWIAGPHAGRNRGIL
jgi:hypothetical protein